MKVNIPDNLNAEIVIALLKNRAKEYSVVSKGIFERNFAGDLLGYEERSDSIEFTVSRDGLYHLLPEALFHRVDRFKNITGKDHAERFEKSRLEQEAEKKAATDLFKPFDNELFHRRVEYQEAINRIFKHKPLFQSYWMIDDKELFKAYLANPYTRKALYFLPHAATIRGDKIKIKLVLKQILGKAITLEKLVFTKLYKDDRTEEPDALPLGDAVCDTTFYDTCFLLSVRVLQPVPELLEAEAHETQLREFCDFFCNYFLPVEEEMAIEIADPFLEPAFDDEQPLFLEYNTQLL